MSVVLSLVLGFVQGLTEFLPISSSGHLVLMQSFAGVTEPMLFFDILLHLGTLGAVVIYYWRDLVEIFTDFVKRVKHGQGLIRGGIDGDGPGGSAVDGRWVPAVIAGTIPTGIIGVLFHDDLDSLFKSPETVSFMLVMTGVILWLSRFAPEHGRKHVPMYIAVLVGFAQGLAITPGISRSGTTIVAGLLLGLERETAARLSFLMSIPAILGAVVLESRKVDPAQFADIGTMLPGVAVAFLTGWVSLFMLVMLVRKGNLHYFSYYTWFAGFAALAAFYFAK